MLNAFTESTFLRIFEKSTNSLIIKADPPRFTMLAASDQYVEMTGTRREDMVGKGVFEVFTDGQNGAEGTPSAYQAFTEVIQTKQAVNLPVYTYQIHDPATGQLKTRYWRDSNVPILDDAGEVAYILNTTTDVTEQRLLEQKEASAILEIKQQQQRINQLFEQAPAAIATLMGPDHVVEIANEKMLELWGKTAVQVLNKPIFEGLPEAKGQGLETLLNRVYTTGERFLANERPIDLPRAGRIEEMYINFVYEPMRDTDGRISGIIVVATDVTEAVRARQKIEESEKRFRNLIEEAPVAMSLLVGQDMVIEFPNEAMLKLWGKGDSIRSKPLREALPELEGQPFLQILDEVYTTGVAYEAQEAMADLVVDGELKTYYFNFTYKPLRNVDGHVYAILDMAIDVTEQVLNRKAIEASEQRFRTLLETIPHMTWTNTPRGGVNFYNQRWYEYTGFGREETRGWLWQSVVHPDDLESTRVTYSNALESGELFSLENRYRRADGQYRWHLNRSLPLRNEAGDIVVWVGTATDIHEQKQLEAELDRQVQQRTQQLQASNQELRRSNDNLQQFAYIASHDLQEPLRKVQSFGDILKTQYANQLGAGIDHLTRMQAAASRMSVLITDLLTFSRISTRQETTGWVGLNQLIARVLDDLDVVIQQTGAIVQVDELPTVQGDALQLGQLFQNLLSNALKFRQPGVTPVIQVTAQLIPTADLPDAIKSAEHTIVYHQINVSDNGIGFDTKYVDRIFEVFQRLHGKNQYAGTGIGLAIVQKVVTNHGGGITAVSKPGEGATFQVFLPA